MKLKKFSSLQIYLTTMTKPGEFIIYEILHGYHKFTFVVTLPTFGTLDHMFSVLREPTNT